MTEEATPAQINTRVDGIGHLLVDRLLAIPDYQRSYSWGEDEVTDLWSDLEKAMSADVSEYFLGSIVTTTTAGNARQLVIDGQQRLADGQSVVCRDARHLRGTQRRASIGC